MTREYFEDFAEEMTREFGTREFGTRPPASARLPKAYEEAARGSIVAYMLQINAIDRVLEYDAEGLRLAIAAVRESGRTVGEIFDAPGEDMILEAFQLLRSNREESIRVLKDAIEGEAPAGRAYTHSTPEEAEAIDAQAMAENRKIAAYPEGCRNCGAIVPFLFRNGLCAKCCNEEGATE